MCGIAGAVKLSGLNNYHRDAGETLASDLRHRGPDGSGIYKSDQALLVHTRLSIIDLESGQQPMSSRDDRYTLIYNGELYNYSVLQKELEGRGHTFETTSDTEVVLKALIEYGCDVVKRFQGMFAFAFWDRELERLIVARDPVGIKPLFYTIQDNCFFFSSELAPLKRFDGVTFDVSPEAMDHYLHYQYVPRTLSIYKDVYKFPPGHVGVFSRSGLETRPYFEFEFENPKHWSEEEALRTLDMKLENSVRMHLRSDVGFGAFLSGGIDSSLVTHYMSKILSAPVKTFTIGFRSDEFDESVYAEKIARYLGTQHETFLLNPRELPILEELLPDLVRHYGEPFADSSAIPTFYVSKLAREQVKMVLSGDGGDELFGGYNTYPNILGQMSALNWNPGILEKVSQMLGRAKKRDGFDREQIYQRHSDVYAYFKDDERTKNYTPQFVEKLRAHNKNEDLRQLFFDQPEKTALSLLQKIDLLTYLPGDILTKVDIASMMNSLEVRVPIIDISVMEFAFTLPDELKISSQVPSEKKYLLKKLALQVFPKELIDRPKRGFGFPLAEMLAENQLKVAEKILNNKPLLDIFRVERLEQLLTKESLKGQPHKVWSLLVLSEWFENNF